MEGAYLTLTIKRLGAGGQTRDTGKVNMPDTKVGTLQWLGDLVMNLRYGLNKACNVDDEKGEKKRHLKTTN